MATFQPFGGATKFFAAMTAAAGLTVIGTATLGVVNASGIVTGSSFNGTSATTSTIPAYVSSTGIVIGKGSNAFPSVKFDTGSGHVGLYSGGTDTLNLAAGSAGSSNISWDGTSLSPSSNNARDLGSTSLAWKSIYATGTQIVFAGLSANDATDSFACVSATGTLKFESGSCTVSSIRFKEHVDSLSNSDLMDKVRKLQAVEFDYKASNGSHGNLGTPHDEGFIAEEVAMVDPYLVVWEVASPQDLKKIQDLYPSVPMKRSDGNWYIPHSVDYMKVSVLESGAIKNIDNRLLSVEKRVGFIEHLLNFLGLIKSF